MSIDINHGTGAAQALAQETPIMARLRAETRGAHDRVEGLPYSEALLRHTLPLERYVAQLHAWYTFHDALEVALESSTHRAIEAVWSPDRAKCGRLKRDLDALDPGGDGAQRIARHHAEVWAVELTELAARAPVGLLGHLYVLEGSTLGGMVLRKHLAEGLGLRDDHGLSYYTVYGRETAARWRAFTASMNDAVVARADQDVVIEQACRAFGHTARVLTSLSSDL